ncbi:23S rRNA (uracil(1939)-C(5))-methyltransferase RlmD [Vibrio algarum]|uniref:23S rRNA (uracil(1939)-C(5))-methyltransferase RlmD n=1 Tax=Vibrio algarum TaxID=3020714 RepID=A0ABT4YTI0_9VIBR|nr:23S rRNA (uracil(1939)-C(5))-methyltransferase RlmD [Vibrio sp. KJ40-1]MDB1124869.1 23S rRNA (uracil(1939)-C(5))-methyltransferase RlmD [Vibrio sp. KJ40-1]
MARFYQPKKKTSLDTKHQQVRVERLDHQGAGIAFLNKKPVFIDGVLPEEEVLIQLTESKSKFSRAKLIKILKSSPERIEAFCPVYKECGGCNMQHQSHAAQIEYKQDSLRQLIKKFSGQELELAVPIIGNEKGYRRRARISLYFNTKGGQSKSSSKLEFGFRKKQSKQIVHISQCAALEPQLNDLLPELYVLLTSFKKPTELGHLELALGDERPVLMLRVMKPLPDKDFQALRKFAIDNALTLYVLSDKDTLSLIEGEKPVYSEGGFVIPFLPTNFIQVNRNVNQQMVNQAVEWLDISPEDRVLDLFCGLGNFSLPMATKAKAVVGVEGMQEMVDQAEANARENGINNVDFYQANLEQDISDNIWAKTKFDKVLLDPARAGASGVIDQLSELGATSIVYVSCNPATLARDCQSLLEQGFKLTRLGMLDMFPHTSHLESMALFQK